MNYDIVSNIYKYLHCNEWWGLAFTSKNYYEIWLKYTKNHKYIITEYTCTIDKNPGDETHFYDYETKIMGIYDQYTDAYKVAFKMACKFGYAIHAFIEQKDVVFKGLGETIDKDPDFVHHGVLTIHYVSMNQKK